MHAPNILFRAAALANAMLLLVACVPLRAQPRRVDPARTWPVDSVLARFESDMRTREAASLGSNVVFDVLDLPASYAARRDSLVDGLERLALTSTDRNVRHTAALRIASAGSVERPPPRLPGVMVRLVRIYRTQEDGLVRRAIRDYLPLQEDRRAAAALLREIAAGPDPYAHLRTDPIGDDRSEALARLSEMGEEGRAVLQAMHRSGEARSPHARAVLDDMARRGFPVKDLRQRWEHP